MDLALLWIPATLAAAAAQTLRNATQRSLTATIGTAGATGVRFLYGLPFALLLLGLVAGATGERVPRPDGDFALFLVGGSLAQILATGAMLAAMRERAFATVTAYVKTEPVQTAAFGVAVLGDPLTLPGALAVAVATLGVVLLSTRGGAAEEARPVGAWRPALLGLAAGAGFALAAIGFRGAILALDGGSFLMRATTTLAWSLATQTAILVVWLLTVQRAALLGSLRAWRPSLAAGFLGALASQFWFIGFALTSAANVRTLALVEVLMAHMIARRLGPAAGRREILGMALVVGGVALLLAVQA